MTIKSKEYGDVIVSTRISSYEEKNLIANSHSNHDLKKDIFPNFLNCYQQDQREIMSSSMHRGKKHGSTSFHPDLFNPAYFNPVSFNPSII